jgi:hypothetical protein
MGFLIRTCFRGPNSGANPLQPIAQSIPTQSGGHARKLRIPQNQNGNFKVKTRSQRRCAVGSINVHHNEFQRRDGFVELELSQALFEPLTETTTSPAEEQ